MPQMPEERELSPREALQQKMQSGELFDGIAGALNSLRHRPSPEMAQSLMARDTRRGQVADEARNRQEQSRTVQFLAQQAGDNPALRPFAEAAAAGVLTGAQAFTGMQTTLRDIQAPGMPTVRATEILPDGTIIQSTDAGPRVMTAGGEMLTGQAADDRIREAQQYGADLQRDIYGARREGTNIADAETGAAAARAPEVGKQSVRLAEEFLGDSQNVRSLISNYSDAIRAIDDGAQSGVIYNMLPDVTIASASLRNSMNRLGINEIQATTFGALSEAEMRFALETAVPQNLSPPKLREWLVKKRDSQTKALEALQAGTLHFARGGDLASWVEQSGAPGAGSAPSSGATVERLRWNPEIGDFQ